MISLISKFFGAVRKSGGEDAPDGIIAKVKGHDALPLARHKLLAGYHLHGGASRKAVAGEASIDGKPLRWREFAFEKFEDGGCKWNAIRWRFYENGLISFHAEMSNASHGIDLGDIQGHRIELRDKDGFLLGIWAAGFYVARHREPVGYQTDAIDDHQPLKAHFADLAEKQQGHWIHS